MQGAYGPPTPFGGACGAPPSFSGSAQPSPPFKDSPSSSAPLGFSAPFGGSPAAEGGGGMCGFHVAYGNVPSGCVSGSESATCAFNAAYASSAGYGSGGVGGPIRQQGSGCVGGYGGPYGGGSLQSTNDGLDGKGESGKGGGKGKNGASKGKGGGNKGGRSGGVAGRWGGGRMGKFERAKNDYAQHFVDTGLRPANFIRDSDVTERFEEYPRLKELIEHKDMLIAERATPLTAKRVDLKSFDLTSLGTKFDVILVDPPWEEYRQRRVACGGEDAADMDVWTPQEIMNLRIDAIADTPSFCFLWSGSGVSLQWGRACLRKWGFRRCEDISWIKSNRNTARNHHWLPDSVLTVTTEHCLMGIKGTVRRNYDGQIINANVDTDVMLSEEPPYGSCEKPTELYSIIEHFANGRRRLELFGEDHNIRRGWLTVGSDLSSNNHDSQTWRSYFEGQRTSHNFEGEPPTVISNHLLGTTPTIEALRPKSPTQLREEAERRQKLERERLEAAEREAIALEVEAARELGIELAPREPRPELPVTPLPTVFVEQHPFNMT